MSTADNTSSVYNAGSVSLSELSDIMIDMMTQCGLIFAPMPSDARTQGQRQDPGLCNNNDNTQQEQSPNGVCVASTMCLLMVNKDSRMYPLVTILLIQMNVQPIYLILFLFS